MRLNTHITHGACAALLCSALLLAPASDALAQSVGNTLCLIYNMTIGRGVWDSGIGRGIATIGVVSLAMAAMFGKVSWGMAITVAVGIVGLFSAWDIYRMLFGVGTC